MPTEIRLVPPTSAGHAAFIDCLADFAGAREDELAGAGIAPGGDLPVGDGAFIDYVTARLAEGDPDTELEDDRVHCSSRWLVSGGPAAAGGGHAPRGRALRAGGGIAGRRA